ncbi:hypothetical protein BGZ95_003411 [Linnemannia exigua]|uniref:F-box domain-containing protein n=1 Tax=Linnemannia exigua TaxID=604196 RepID=A0AAD4DHZ7_9FUNG|nr:hypothetical protein BGZ95_003411 [Linnemannia exigua]
MSPQLPGELWDMVAASCNQYDLYNLCLASKEFNTTFTRHLYFDISISTPRQEAAFLTSECRQALRHNCIHFRRFKTRSDNPEVLAVLKDLPRLVLTHLNLCGWDLSTKGIDHFIEILKKNPFLWHLRIFGPPKYSSGVENGGRLLKVIARTQQNLRKLELFEGSRLIAEPWDIREFFETVSPYLDYLAIRLTVDQLEYMDPKQVLRMKKPVKGRHATHPYLTTLKLDIGLRQPEDLIAPQGHPPCWPMILIPFINGCPNLVDIEDDEGEGRDDNLIRSPTWIHTYPAVRAALKKIFTFSFTQCVFDARYPEWGTEDLDCAMEIQAIMDNDDYMGEPVLCQLVHLDRFMVPFPRTMRTIGLAARSGFIRNLFIEDGEKFESLEILKILRQARGVMQRMHSWKTLPVLYDSVLDPKPWICINLTQLEIQIRSVFRPDIKTNYRGEPLPNLDDGWYHEDFYDAIVETHRSIYKRLASLSNLQILTLGLQTDYDKLESSKNEAGKKVYFDPLLQIDCLDFSLEYGLDILGALTQMRRLAVNHMDHRIGVKELKWMDRNWPCLECVQGVIRNTNNPKKPYGRPFAVDDPVIDKLDMSFYLY